MASAAKKFSVARCCWIHPLAVAAALTFVILNAGTRLHSTRHLSNFVFSSAPVSDSHAANASSSSSSTPVLPGSNNRTLHEMHASTLGPGCRHFLNHSTSQRVQTPPPSTSKIPPKIMFLLYNEQLENPRMLCAIESALLHNPHHKVTLYAKDPTALNRTGMSTLLESINPASRQRLRISKLNWPDGIKGTPLEPWFTNGTYKNSEWVDQNLGNAFRLGMLWKSGGVYLDLDIVSVNPIGEPGRAVGQQNAKMMNNAFLRMQKADPFLWKVMDEFVKRFRGYKWGHNGPAVISRVLYTCYADFCKSINRLAPTAFYPFNYTERVDQLIWTDHCDRMRSLADDTIGLHYWNRGLRHAHGSEPDSILNVVMSLHCPTVFESFYGQRSKNQTN